MKSFKFLINGLWAVLIFSFLSACTDEVVEFSADADVIFIKKVVDEDTVFATDFYVYGNMSVTSATVTSPEGSTYQIDSYSSGYSYADITDDDDYTSSIPTTGTYTFNLTASNDATLELTDSQNFYNLDFAEVDSTSFYEYYDGFYVSWEPVSGADSYVVLLYDSSDNLIFTGDEIDADTHEFNVITGYDGDWYDTPGSDEIYTLQIMTIIYDDDASDSDSEYNIQEISCSDKSITWE